jgi:nucleoside transporter
MTLGLRIRLSAMMFLEFFIWGAWVTVLNVYIGNLGKQVNASAETVAATTNTVYGLMGLASIFMPIIAGQITDRWVPTQIFLALAQLAGGAGLILAAVAGDFSQLKLGMLIWALAYAPTISLTNSLAFTHIKDAEKDFGAIRVFGTLGWIASNWILSAWRYVPDIKIGGNDCLYLAGAASILMGLFCFGLPHTPPAKSGVSPFAFARAFSLLGKPRVAVFLLVSFGVGVAFYFYFTLGGNFLKHLGASEENIPLLQSIGNFSEIAAMLALPWCLKKWGVRTVLFLGALFGALRYAIFALGEPYGLVVASLFTHGFFFTFFFVVGFIFIDSVAPKDIKASAQGLLTLVVFGFSNWIGNNYVIGAVQKHFTVEGQPTPWTPIWLTVAVVTFIGAVIFLVTFPKGGMKEASGSSTEGS